MIVHIDSSAVVAVLLHEPGATELHRLSDTLYASDLVAVETRRVIHRLRLNGQYTDESVAAALDNLRTLEESVTFVEVTRQILASASQPFPVHVRTLDAIHLATATANSQRLNDLSVTLVTLDQRMATAASSLGFEVIGA